MPLNGNRRHVPETETTVVHGALFRPDRHASMNKGLFGGNKLETGNVGDNLAYKITIIVIDYSMV